MKVYYFFLLIFCIGIVSALSVNIPSPVNYSLVNVNNSQYWQGHTGTDGSWLTDISTYNSSYVPYTGATSNVDLGDYNITAEWFKGKFNWTSTDNWNIFDGSILTFNESKLSTTYYNAIQSSITSGVIDGGSLADTQHNNGNYDGKTFNFSESAGSPALDIKINFTDVDSFNQGIIRYKTSSLAGDYPTIQLWNYEDGLWEDYPNMAQSSTFITITQPVFDSSEHTQDGVVQIRLYKASNGNTNNHYYVDWIAVSKGYGTPSGEEIDPLSWHRDNNMEFGNFTTTGRITASELNITGTSYLGDFVLNGNVDLGSGDLTTTGKGTFGNTYQAILGNDGNSIAGYFTDGTNLISLADGNYAVYTDGDIYSTSAIEGYDLVAGNSLYTDDISDNGQGWISVDSDLDGGGSYSLTSWTYLKDNNGYKLLDFNNRQLIANDGFSVMLNWMTTGNLDAQNNNITTTGDGKFNNLFASNIKDSNGNTIIDIQNNKLMLGSDEALDWSTGNLKVPDWKALILGDGSDGYIYSDSSDMYIQSFSSNNLYIDGFSDVDFSSTDLTTTGTGTFDNIVLGSGTVMSAGSTSEDSTMDFLAHLNSGDNAFRLQFREGGTASSPQAGGYIQYNSDANFLEFGGTSNAGVDNAGFSIDRDTGKTTFYNVQLPDTITIGDYSTDTSIQLRGKTNSATASRLNLYEASGIGGYMRYDGSSNKIYLGTTFTYTDTDAFYLSRGSADVNFLGDISTIGNISADNYISNGNIGFTGTCVNVTYSGGIAISCND